MPYIYLITNDVNGKQYIGKTERNIEQRWKEHCKDINRKNFEIRPLYRAMSKYGIEHFHIEMIEECNNDIVNEREQYWISKLNTYGNGYNATYGGDGKRLLDYDLIIKTYKSTLNAHETSKILGIDRQTITDILKSTKAFSQEEIINNGKQAAIKRKVGQYDKDTNELIAVYNGVEAAEKEVPTGRHITDVCNGRRKIAGGYIWKYIEK